MKPKSICLIGLLFFVVSYIMFSQGSKLAYFQKPIDFAHWFNLIGAVLLLSFNKVFPKNKWNTLASFLTALGVIAHIGLCTIDFIMWSFENDDNARMKLSEHISNTPSILYPFIIIGPSLLFIGLAVHASNFIKTHTLKALLVILGAPAVGFSFFILKNGVCMVLSCMLFSLGLTLLLYRKETVKQEI
ncbi:MULTISPECIES: hypothetical protein [Flavobacterium]|uniref:hypothetical protein n=1 Tax=Flavobacterium TaxID=237 RepID=UPI000868A6E3|nr:MULTISPECIES: hypothetical protein [Flavobacterium]MBN9284851.1 hypothetical protein [Flavobacterium sp.]ODS84952.1 MAG: hypothetical protein ABS44_15940 [Chryseobacterium sp. SCN 40-13]OJV71346.1 MAG: hypothetical protein BGO42_07985 [Flavobacterium sp. 40-81]